jgi:hypothetical protein
VQAPTRTTEKTARPAFFAHDSNCWLFCFAIVLLKFLLFALDSSPKFYLGDSISYIWTALTGWIPDDRSYFYGFVIRWTSVWTHSLMSLVTFQVLLGCIIAVIVAWICRVIVDLPEKIAYLFGFLCAIDPLQVTWEHYILTETCSLFFYALVLQQSFVYLRDRRVFNLVLVQFLSVMTVGFRMVFLIPVEVMALALPIIAFVWRGASEQAGDVARWQRFQFLLRREFWQHLVISVAALLLFDQAYQRAYGFLTHREPAHLHAGGYFLLAICAPSLQPQDAADPRLAGIIEHGDEFGLKDSSLRNNQRFIAGYLVDRWRHAEPNRVKAQKIATQTALRAIRRDPFAFVGFAARTYLILLHQTKRFAQWDLNPDGKLKEAELKYLAERFHWTGPANVGSEPQTPLQWYYVAATPWFLVPMLSPLIALVLLFIAFDKAHAYLLFLHTVVLFAVTLLLSTGPFTRYFQPISLLTLLMMAVAVKSCLRRRFERVEAVVDWFSRIRSKRS